VTQQPNPKHGPPEKFLAGLLLRPPGSLEELPIDYRWQVTRRHPYYLQYWQRAHEHRAGMTVDPVDRQIGEIATLILLSIGVSGDPPPPDSQADALGSDQLAAAWRGGAVGPLTYRGLSMLLLVTLPPQTRRVISQLLQESAPADGDESETQDLAYRYRAAAKLRDSKDPEFDKFPNRPILGINIHAPINAVLQAMEQMLRQWKTQEGVPPRRRRDDKYEDYLQVWDLREGWVHDHYEIDREQTFISIAAQLKIPLGTVANRYRSAFELISGHRYSFENWWQLFVMLKLSNERALAVLRRRRPMSPERQSDAVDQVPESLLQSGRSEGRDGLLAALAEVAPDSVDQLLDLKSLLKEGYTDDAIIKRLDPKNPKEMKQLVKVLRSRLEESTG
jgi:hypothetical protein